MHFLAQALEEEGIQYIQANENTATMLPHLRQGIQVRVKDVDYLKARHIADRVEAMTRLRCPKCQSNNLKYLGPEERELTTTEFILKLVHFPVQAHLLIYTCSNCGTVFKTK